jgi:hypothetical protein
MRRTSQRLSLEHDGHRSHNVVEIDAVAARLILEIVRQRCFDSCFPRLSASNARATDNLGADQWAAAPNRFACGLCVPAAQNKFARHFKIRWRANAHAAVGFVDNQAVARCRTGFDQDHPYVPNGPAPRATPFYKSGRDHGVTNGFGKP